MARIKPMVHSIKHYISSTNTSVASGAARVVVLADAILVGTPASTLEIIEGSTLKSVFIEHWIKSSATAGTSVQFSAVLEKVPANASSASVSNVANLQAYENKKNVLWHGQGVLGDTTTQGVPILRQWFKIPKGKQRFGFGDRLVLTIVAVGEAFRTCGSSTYKEYS